jgi:hypothetical protein
MRVRKNIFVSISLASLFIAAASQSQSLRLFHHWSDVYGRAWGARRGVASDQAGNVYIAGTFNGHLNFGGEEFESAGVGDIYLAQFNSEGQHIWSKSFGDSENQNAMAIVCDNDGDIIVLGINYGTVNFGNGPISSEDGIYYMAKFDPSGMHLWTTQFGGGSISLHNNRVSVDSFGNIILTGKITGAVDFGGGPLAGEQYGAVYIAKFDSNGSHVWSIHFPGRAEAYGVAADEAGNIFITGGFDYELDFGCGLLPKNFPGSGKDIYVAKFNSSGSCLWSRSFDGQDNGWGEPTNSDDYGYDLTVDPAGDLIVTGVFTGEIVFVWPWDLDLIVSGENYIDNLFLVKFDTDGSHIWSMGGHTNELSGHWDFSDNIPYAINVEVDGAGNIYLAGTLDTQSQSGCYQNPNTSGPDIHLWKFDREGIHCLDGKQFGGEESQWCHDIAVDALGNLIMTGTFFDSVDFGGEEFVAETDGTLYLARFSQSDTDADGIDNEIDLDPILYSNEFSDVGLGGTTTGRIVNREYDPWEDVLQNVNVSITNESDPSGVRIKVLLWKYGSEMSFNVCGAGFNLEKYKEMIITCSSMMMKAVVGPVDAFLGPGLSAVVHTGASIEMHALGGGQSEILSLPESTAPIEITLDGQTTTLSAGQSLTAAVPEGPAVCYVYPETVDFGTVSPGASSTESFVVKNTGASILSGFPTVACDEFSLASNDAFHLAAGESVLVAGTFAPSSHGEYSCRASLGTDECGDVVLHGVCEGALAVDFDVRPRSCPNPVNIKWLNNFEDREGNGKSMPKKGGVLPVAIVGSAHFDVKEVDVSTIHILGVPPLRHDYEDVSTAASDGEACACSLEGADGFEDLTLKFDLREIIEALGTVEEDQTILLTISGVLLDGTALAGTDCILIKDKDPDIPGISESNAPVLGLAIPNPFNPTTRIRYDVPARGGKVTLRIYDVEGRLVRTLVNEHQSPGQKIATWHGRNAQGQSVATGVYFYRMTAPGFEMTRKMILLK